MPDGQFYGAIIWYHLMAPFYGMCVPGIRHHRILHNLGMMPPFYGTHCSVYVLSSFQQSFCVHTYVCISAVRIFEISNQIE